MDINIEEIVQECNDTYTHGFGNWLMIALCLIDVTLTILYIDERWLIPILGDTIESAILNMFLCAIGAFVTLAIVWVVNFFIIYRQNQG